MVITGNLFYDGLSSPKHWILYTCYPFIIYVSLMIVDVFLDFIVSHNFNLFDIYIEGLFQNYSHF